VHVRPRFRHLAYLTRASPDERALLVGSALLLGVTRLVLPRLSLRRVERILSGVPLPARRTTAHFAPGRIVDAVGVIAARFGVTCLGRALVLRELLVRRGDTPRVRIGVALTGNGTLHAHAWVEDAAGRVVGGTTNPANYALLPPLPPLPPSASARTPRFEVGR
jgi:hypothetical protein